MKTRRSFLLTLLTAGLVATAIIVAPVIADELFGVITKVDVAGKKITVEEKETDKVIEVSVPDSAEFVTPKGASPVDLEKLEKGVAKSIEKGKKGVRAKITHEKGVASRITVVAKKKEAPKEN